MLSVDAICLCHRELGFFEINFDFRFLESVDQL